MLVPDIIGVPGNGIDKLVVVWKLCEVVSGTDNLADMQSIILIRLSLLTASHNLLYSRDVASLTLCVWLSSGHRIRTLWPLPGYRAVSCKAEVLQPRFA